MPVELDGDDVRHELDVRVGLGLGASEDQLNQLLSISRQVELAAGQVLFTRGAPVAKLYRLSSGIVELTAPPLPRWRVVDRGAIGFLDLMQGRPHARTATATAPARVLEIDAADYREYLEDNFDVCYRLIEQFAHALVAGLATSSDPAALLAQPEIADARTFANVEIPVVERVLMLARLPMFRGASTQALADLAQRATEARHAPGEQIAETGAVSVLVSGAVELALPDGTRIRRAGRGLLAHADELVAGARVFTAYAATPTVVLQLDREDFLDRMDEHFELASALFAYLATERDRLVHVIAGNTEWETSGGIL